MINLGPLVQAWTTAIDAAQKDKAGFDLTADACMQFFTGSVGFMWKNDFRQKHKLQGLPAPQFEITISKAFELVSIVGPTLMWSHPGRYVSGYERLDLDPAIFPMMQGIDLQHPAAQQIAEAYMREQSEDKLMQDSRNALMQHYLNYTPREQPGGGLRFDSQLAIIDAIVKGRGVIRVDAYLPDGADSPLTGGFYVDVDDLFVDPNCTRPNWSNAEWIAIRHVEPHWKVERRFGWPEDSLKGKAVLTGKEKNATIKHRNSLFAKTSTTSDLVVWFEIFSKCGAGTRLKTSGASEWHDAFEQSVGDFAYLCIAKGVNEPLNLRSDFLETADVEQVGQALDWPIPYYKDGRWPVCPLDFWHQPKSAWPLAPLAMGLGELICLNVFISSMAERIYRDTLKKTAFKAELANDAVKKLLSLKHEVIELNGAIAGNINELISEVQSNPMNFDVFRFIEWLSMSFDKRVGLMELMYGLNPGGKVSRTAADANIKGEAVSVRPEHMAAQVEQWQSDIANNERIAAGHAVSGESLVPLLGRHGAEAWTQLITAADPQVYMREMRSRVEANSLRRPNKARDNQNMQQMTGYMLPMLQWYAGSTGDTEPLNGYLKTIGKATDQDVEPWLMPPIQPPQPSPEEMQAAQEEQAMKRQAMELDMAKKKASIDKAEIEKTRTAHQMLMEGAGLPAEMLQEVDVMPEETFTRPI